MKFTEEKLENRFTELLGQEGFYAIGVIPTRRDHIMCLVIYQAQEKSKL